MKTIVEINSNNYGSTGNIAIDIANEAKKAGYNVYAFFKPSKESKKHNTNANQFFIGFWIDRVISERLAYITGLKDRFNIINTLVFINKLKHIKPDLIHIHALHDSYVNIKILFKFIKKNNIPIIWTFHDEWAFTGKCTTFEISGCKKWQNGCGNCPMLHEAPSSMFFDFSKQTWKLKKTLYSKDVNLTIVSPSIWLSNLVKQSFLSNVDTRIINNGINLNVFKPTDKDIKSLDNDFKILGVASYWGTRKGLDVFIKLAKDLPNNYHITLVGTNDDIDKILPSNIKSIHKTSNQEELAKIYSSANVFVNPTREDNLPTVNIEALACGIPVITYNTGGSGEVFDTNSGSIIEKEDYQSLLNEIIRVCETKPYSEESCLKRAKHFNKIDKYQEYIELYKEKLGDI